MTIPGKCSKCRNNAEINSANQLYCRNCFLDVIDKRIKKSMKGKLEKGEKVLVLDEITKKAFGRTVSIPVKALFKNESFFGNENIGGIVAGKKFSDFLKKEKIAKALIPWTADMEASELLENFFTLNRKISDNNYVKFFKGITEEELEEYSNILEADYCSETSGEAAGFAAEVENQYPGTIFSLAKSKEALDEILGKMLGKKQRNKKGKKK